MIIDHHCSVIADQAVRAVLVVYILWQLSALAQMARGKEPQDVCPTQRYLTQPILPADEVS